jgi:hypothetical protein
MTAREFPLPSDAPAREADRAQRFYEALLDIVSGSGSTSPRFPAGPRAEGHGALPAPAPHPCRRA